MEPRDYSKAQDGAIRAMVDPTFTDLHDALTEAYYQHWRHGRSSPWQGYDVQATPAESKALFDRLHGVIFHLREVALADADQAQPVRDRIPAHRRPDRAMAAAAIAEAAAQGLTITVPRR